MAKHGESRGRSGAAGSGARGDVRRVSPAMERGERGAEKRAPFAPQFSAAIWSGLHVTETYKYFTTEPKE